MSTIADLPLPGGIRHPTRQSTSTDEQNPTCSPIFDGNSEKNPEKSKQIGEYASNGNRTRG